MNLSILSAQVKGETLETETAKEAKEDMGVVFEMRHTMSKKYNVAICHGSRLICDADVYDKRFQLLQVL